MSGAKQRYEREYKLAMVNEMTTGKRSLERVAREEGLNPSMLRRWKQAVAADPEGCFPGSGKAAADDPNSKEGLKRRIAQLELENEILKKAQAYLAGKRR
jgi:transposase